MKNIKNIFLTIIIIVTLLIIVLGLIYGPKPKPCPEVVREQTSTEKLWDAISDLQKQGIVRIDIQQNKAVMRTEDDKIVFISYGPIPFDVWNKEVEKYKHINGE